MSIKQPERTCIACRKKGNKQEFFKVVLNKSGKISVELETKLDGRGAYICKNEQCLLKAPKSKAFSRAFKTDVPNEIYEDLLNEFRKEQN